MSDGIGQSATQLRLVGAFYAAEAWAVYGHLEQIEPISAYVAGAFARKRNNRIVYSKGVSVNGYSGLEKARVLTDEVAHHE